jgi:peptidoglycan/xylan/chitin deacetylase (PgdA/CDA1 family)
MNPIRTLASFCGGIAYAIGPERWIPLLTRRVICSVRTKERKIVLTFEDGPNPEYTPLLLAKLAEYRVSATFFLIGCNVKRHPEIGRCIVQEGHEVGNHTYNDRSLPLLSNVVIINKL